MMHNTYTGTPLDKKRFFLWYLIFHPQNQAVFLGWLTSQLILLPCAAQLYLKLRKDWIHRVRAELLFQNCHFPSFWAGIGGGWGWGKCSPTLQTGVRSSHMSLAVKKHIFYQVSSTSRGNTTFLCTQKRISGYLKQTHMVASIADLFPSLATWERRPVWNIVVNTLLHLSQWPCKNPSWLFCRKRKIRKELKK